ncbi:MAG: site-2 protease family protein [Candidatus Pacebacteria bacterium]|nr:site-2 protease family protein [Candidatus Paceibacterota bacterium]
MAIIIFQFAVFIISVIVHEISHGAVAYWLGDETAYRMGRLTMNPVSHIDPFGSIILPLVLSIPLFFGIQPVIVGWAKPVPYNPNNLKNPKSGAGLIAWAGPASNLLIACVFAGLLAFISINPQMGEAFQYIILINLMLAVFNLVPIPPLDGSKILTAFLPNYSPVISFIERNSMVLLLAFLIFGLSAVQMVVGVLYSLLV